MVEGEAEEMKDKITFDRLSGTLKLAVVGGLISALAYAVFFVLGIVEAWLGV